MSLSRTYLLRCDSCSAIHNAGKTGYTTPRRARAAARHDGWQRRTVVVGKSSYPDYEEDAFGQYRYIGQKEYDVRAGRDYCENCLDAMEVGG